MEKKILIADDNDVNRMLLRQAFSRTMKEFKILEAENGEIALQIMRSDPVSIVILDIMMPVKDGITTLIEMKEDVRLKDIPVIIFSADTNYDTIEKALKYGAYDYITKPINKEKMLVELPLKIKNATENYSQKQILNEFYKNMNEDLEIASIIQRRVITKDFENENMKMSGWYMPCEIVGGDIFLAKQVKNKTWFLIADVTGHGISAAMLAVSISFIFSEEVLSNTPNPEELLKKLNKLIVDIYGEFEMATLTGIAAVLEDDNLTLTNAGHPPPILMRDHGSVEQIELSGHPIGMFSDPEFDSQLYKLHKDDVVLFYTDGLFDNGDEGDFAYWDKIKDYCEKFFYKFKLDENKFFTDISNYHKYVIEKKNKDDLAIMLVKKK